MPKISKTFCPAKWDELHLNFNFNYAYGCCKASPIVFDKDWNPAIDKQKENLLNGIQDSSCNYCWNIENAGGISDRHIYVEQFDTSQFELYANNSIEPNTIEVNLGNECNFQCTYCNPKFSSKWETDMKTRPYKFKTDIGHYNVAKKKNDNIENNLNFLKDFKNIKVLNLIGGEPLQNKKLFEILNGTEVEIEILSITTNLSCDTNMLDKLITLADNYKNLRIGISIDATGDLAEFTRYGLNYKKWQENVEYLLMNMKDNTEIIFLSLLSSLTIYDLSNTNEMIDSFARSGKPITWRLSYCVSPRIQSFDTLKEKIKIESIEILEKLKSKNYIKNIEVIIEALTASNFNTKLYDELMHFVNEFSDRKNIKIPTCLN